jgi:small nuclear ribonucleoprotein (snRNP)-like protein
MLLPLAALGQGKIALVKLKNGTEIKGIIKSIDPMDAMVIEIAGVEATIKMDNVQMIEEMSMASQDSNSSEQELYNEKLIVTDFEEYPDSIDLAIGNQKIRMILVRGGDYMMGFDGRHSMAMKSEPVHKVMVTSFYISKFYVTSDIVKNYKKKVGKETFYQAKNWEDANNIATAISEDNKLPLRLPTEAEWEFAACSSVQNRIFDYCGSIEYCSDFFGKFNKWEEKPDPTGPINGKHHVIRAYNQVKGKYNRTLLCSRFRLLRRHYCRVKSSVRIEQDFRFTGIELSKCDRIRKRTID